jgi:anti-sigma regulatory factor (Ser/Thr protein kinase)
MSGQEGAVRLKNAQDLQATLEAPGTARHALAAFLEARDLGKMTPVATLLVSELVTNSVRHGRAPISVTASFDGRCLHVAVRDDERALPAPRSPSDDGGWGLHIVEGFADAWGCRYHPAGGKVTWFELSA